LTLEASESSSSQFRQGPRNFDRGRERKCAQELLSERTVSRRHEPWSAIEYEGVMNASFSACSCPP
jgi:hypothetical protein